MGVDGVRRLQRGTHFFGHQQRGAPGGLHVRRHVVHQHHKLVPSQAGHGVARALQLREPLGHLHQQHVAHRVPARVVDLLEIVQVDVEHGPHLCGLLRVGQRVFHAVQQHAPVGQAGERIKVRQLV